MDIRLAEISDLDGIIALIQKRMDWMDEVGLCQWNKTNYLEEFTKDYFEKNIIEKNFYIAEEDGLLIGTIALFRQDLRWEDGKESVYIHHLTAEPGKAGVGRKLVEYAEQYAKNMHFQMIRLDSPANNQKLSDYYESMGYMPVGRCANSFYEGILREKKLL
ncbi:MAG: GNAT family N-acetyltransferase [Clostridiales bacterium]|nr:GNAT family N-acetyltransferase [Clostridiales bacterium]